MAAGLEALVLGLEVVPVATTATVDELLALLAGGIEEEAAEESLAVPTDRGQVAEVCVVQGNRLSQGWQMDGAKPGTARALKKPPQLLSLLNTKPFPPAASSAPTSTMAPRTCRWLLPTPQHGALLALQDPARAQGYPRETPFQSAWLPPLRH